MIPCYWIHYRHGQVRCRWDQQMVDRIIQGLGKRPGWFPDVVHYETMESFLHGDVTESCIVMFPAGAHDERDVGRFNRDLARHRNPVVFFTSDEGSTFPVHLIQHPELTVFVSTPRTDREYPPEAFRMGEGDADAGSVHEVDPTLVKDVDIYFSGQGGHRRRQEMFEAFGDWMGADNREPQHAVIQVMKTPELLAGDAPRRLPGTDGPVEGGVVSVGDEDPVVVPGVRGTHLRLRPCARRCPQRRRGTPFLAAARRRSRGSGADRSQLGRRSVVGDRLHVA